MLIAVFVIAISLLIIIFKYEDNKDYLNNYVILCKEEYENLKETFYNQKIKIKAQNKIINKLKGDKLK